MLELLISEVKENSLLSFKNNAPFISCISKINGVLIENAKYLDVVMPIYNLLEYRKIIQGHLALCELSQRWIN